MKKLFYRHLEGINPRKSEVSMEEITDRIGNKMSRKWLCKYFLKEKFTSKNIELIQDWIAVRKKGICPKNCHIIKYTNTATGKNKIVCKVLGNFFIVFGDTVFNIVYVNEIKIKISGDI